MNRINLSKYTNIKVTSVNKRNVMWEEAEHTSSYLKIRPAFIYKMFKLYGKNRVLLEVSYLKDLPSNYNLYATLTWKLKTLDIV